LSVVWISWRSALRELLQRSVLVLLGAGILAALLFALLERRSAPAFAFDRALLGSAFGLLLPLGCFVICRALFRTGIEPALADFAAMGVDRRRPLFGRGGALIVSGSVLALPLALGVLVVAGPTSSWTRELGAVAWVAAFAGVAYAALMLAGVSLGRHGPWSLLLLDWLLGGGSGWLALPWPRGHVRGLLGGAGILDLGQGSSALVLLGLAATCVAVSFARTSP
jgi:hypothetical protein